MRMALFDWWRPKGREKQRVPKEPLRALPANRNPLIPNRPQGHGSNHLFPLGGARYGGFIEPEDFAPERWHPFLRFVRDHIPDVAAGVWAWVRLCSTNRVLELIGGSESDRESARRMIASLEERLLESTFDHRPGFDGIAEQFFQAVFTVGSYAGEVVASPDRKSLARFSPIDPATVRFKQYPTSGRLVPYQLGEDGSLAPLNEASFFYFGLDADASSPYGRSPLSSLPFVLRLQQQLFEDMGKAAHNAGYPTLHVKYHAPQREPGENLADYQNRVQADFESISAAMKTRTPDSNFLTQNNIDIQYIGPSGQMLRWKETLETISEQVVAALHLAPFLIGRNYGTTQSWARAQYDLMVNNAASVQRAAARLVDWIANLELALEGSPVRAKCRFAPHNSWNDIDEARAQNIRVATLLKLRDSGLLTQDQVMAKVGEL
jgi:hypothetical protein